MSAIVTKKEILCMLRNSSVHWLPATYLIDDLHVVWNHVVQFLEGSKCMLHGASS
jgi:hypothetical protein